MSGIAEPADASEPTTANLSELLTAHYSLLCVALFRLSDGAVFAVPSIPSNYISNVRPVFYSLPIRFGGLMITGFVASRAQDPLFRVDTSDLPQCVTDCMESSSTLPVPPAYAPWFHYTLSPIASVAHATALHVCPLPGIGFSLLATVNVPATMASPPPHPPLLTAQSSLSSVFDVR